LRRRPRRQAAARHRIAKVFFFTNPSTEATDIPEFLGSRYDFPGSLKLATSFDAVEIGPKASSSNRFDFVS